MKKEDIIPGDFYRILFGETPAIFLFEVLLRTLLLYIALLVVVRVMGKRMGGQLTIRAPNSRQPKLGPDSSLQDRINYILYNEINPGLASHGGNVSLEKLTEDNVAVLRFGGGCQGCSAVDLTLKDGVEKTLMQQLPELTAVRDVTDHSDRANAYYKK